MSGNASAIFGPSESGGRAGAPSLDNTERDVKRWWPLIAILLLAAGWRLGTLGSQSLWYDEAFTPVHVLHAGLGATLRSVAHTENSPPLWYMLEWVVYRLFGDGAFALRAISALAGVAAVAVAWAIGSQLVGRRAAIAAAALLAANPLLVWYSQEARSYGLFVFTIALAMLCFLRALERPIKGRLIAFALSASAALLTHYFAVFLLAPMVLFLLFDREPHESDVMTGKLGRALYGAALPVVVGAALIPLILAQAGHGTQWIGQWALASRLEAIPQYYLTGYTGSSLGHGIELLVLAIALTGVGYGLWRGLDAAEERGAALALAIAACGALIPIALAFVGADYLAPRNLVGAMVPVTVLLAVVIVARRTGNVGVALAALLVFAFAALSVDVYLSPRLQRGDWAGLARAIGPMSSGKVLTTVELGSAPLQYYLHGLRNLPSTASVPVSEIDEAGYAPLRSSAGSPPAGGFHLVARQDVNGLILYRFRSSKPVWVSEAQLRRHVITLARPEVLVASATTRSAARIMH